MAPPVFRSVMTRDQFLQDLIQLDTIHFLSNPAQKDAHPIIDPDDHLTWYRARGQALLLDVEFVNQFQRDTVRIDSLRYFLVPTQKQPHPPYDSMDHYKAYRIQNPQAFSRPVQMQDQFAPEFVNQLIPRYFLTPTRKNAEPVYDSATHYVAYEFFPKRILVQTRQTQDQFGFHNLRVDSSFLILVPTLKLSFRPPSTECSDGVDNDGDGFIDFPADCGCTDPSDPTEAPNPPTECSDGIDNDGDGLIDLADCGCTDVCDGTEAPNPATACNDGVDNDGDGLIDLADCGCTDGCDASEAPNPITACSDGVDNDGDGFIDFPADPGCTNACDPDEFNPPPTTEQNHYKTWRIFDLAPPVFRTVQVVDQFMTDFIQLDTIHYLSNPAQKDAHPIVDPDDHLTWYRATGRNFPREIYFRNQFGVDSVRIDTLDYLLVPTQKFPHPPPDSVDHYKAYRIRNPQPFNRPTNMLDQFAPELVNQLIPRYLLTPTRKNADPLYDTVTHYVAYEFFPKRILVQTRQTQDQFGPHNIRVDSSMYLLVPSDKTFVCPCAKGDLNCSGGFSPADVVCLLNCVFLGGAGPPCVCDFCVADVNCSGNLSPADVVLELNRVFLGLTTPPWCGS